MAHINADRVRESASTTGTGAFTLAGAATGFRTFASVAVDGDTFPYCAVNGTEWEVGLGTRSSSTVMARTAVLSSSNSGALVSFTSAPTVFLTPPGAHWGSIARVTRTSDQSVANNTATAVSWQAMSDNNVTAWVVGSPTRITVPAGYTSVRLTATAVWASDSTGNRWLQFVKNGTALWEGAQLRPSALESALTGIYGWAPCTVGDYFELQVQQTSGGALNLAGATTGATMRAEFR